LPSKQEKQLINFIKGELIGIGEDSLNILVGPVGLDINVSPRMCSKMSEYLGEEVGVYTYFTLITSRNSTSLFLAGFESNEEREVFKKLLTVPGIGTKVALSILSIGTEELITAIDEGRVDVLSSIPGIGKSKARQIITSLAGKVVLEERETTTGPSGEFWDTARSALLKLGFNDKEIQHLLNKAYQDIKEPESVEQIMNRVFEE
jgi:Holliday junction DNA helicase RuvA